MRPNGCFNEDVKHIQRFPVPDNSILSVTAGECFIADGMSAFSRRTKRIGDCILALVLLVVFSPLFLVCYIAVRREDGSPAIFRQERIGRGGRPFTIYKFRSMRMDAESGSPRLSHSGGGRRPAPDEDGPFPAGLPSGRAAAAVERIHR